MSLALFFSYLNGQVEAAGQVWENRDGRKWHKHSADNMTGHPAGHQLQKWLSATEHIVQVERHTVGMEVRVNSRDKIH